MRDLFRLIAVGAMSLAIVGLAMVYSRGGDVSTVFAAVSESVSGTVEGIGSAMTGTASADTPELPTHVLSIARPRPAAWVGLAGFPDQTEIAFPVPRGGSYLSGALDLSFDTQLTEHGDGLMTLSVNGTPRGQIVLDSGRQTHAARIELNAADLSGDRIVLHMAGRGTTSSGQICPVDAANSGSAVTLAATSRLELVSDQAPADAVTTLLASPGTLALRPGTQAGDTALAVWTGQQLRRAGIDARLSAGGPGETPVIVTGSTINLAGTASTALLSGDAAVTALVAAAGSSLPQPAAGSVSVADLGGETIVKSFRGSRRWTIPFNAADMPGGALPETFSLRLKTTPLAGTNDWVVRVVLNGNLVETHRVAGSTDTLSFDIALPPERLLPGNVLSVELVDTTPNEGICARAPDAQAQLLPESVLTDKAPASAAWAVLVETLAAAPAIALDADGLTLVEAGRASDLLSLILPRTARPQFTGDAPVTLKAVARGSIAAAVTTAGAANTKVLLPVSSKSGLSLAVLSPGADLDAALERLGADDVAVLVTTR
jgi:hypothetical protein